MIPFILIPWAAIGITIPIVKGIVVVSRSIDRKKHGGKTRLKDVIEDVQYGNAAEKAAYMKTAKCLCGGEHAPDKLVKGTSIAMKCITSISTPSVGDLIDKDGIDYQ